MHEQQPEQPGPRPERAPNETPRLYVASLSDYNNGVLHGLWLDATEDPEDINQAVQQMLATSPSDPHAEEVAIHDYEYFGPLRIDEYDPLPELCRIARGIAEHGQAFAHWADVLGRSDWSRLEDFEDHYRGCWPSLADYAEEFAEEMGTVADLERVPDWLSPFVSVAWDQVGEYLASDMLTSRGDEGVYMFDP